MKEIHNEDDSIVEIATDKVDSDVPTLFFFGKNYKNFNSKRRNRKSRRTYSDSRNRRRR